MIPKRREKKTDHLAVSCGHKILNSVFQNSFSSQPPLPQNSNINVFFSLKRSSIFLLIHENTAVIVLYICILQTYTILKYETTYN